MLMNIGKKSNEKFLLPDFLFDFITVIHFLRFAQLPISILF